MAGPTLDPNLWYHLYVTSGPGQGLIGNKAGDGAAKSGVWFNPTNVTSPKFRWQTFQLNSTTWTLRCNDSGPHSYLSAGWNAVEEVEGQTRPYIARGDIADASAFWTISPWGDGTYYMWNAANSSDYRMMKKGSGLMAMSPNITAPQAGQRWTFDKIAEINDPQYSSIGLLEATTSTSASISSSASRIASSTPSSSATPPPKESHTNDPTSEEISPAVKAAIGVSVSFVFLVVMVIFCLYLFRRRKRSHHYNTSAGHLPPKNQHHYATPGAAKPLRDFPSWRPEWKYEMADDGAARSKIPAQYISEAPVEERLSELPGTSGHR